MAQLSAQSEKVDYVSIRKRRDARWWRFSQLSLRTEDFFGYPLKRSFQRPIERKFCPSNFMEAVHPGQNQGRQ